MAVRWPRLHPKLIMGGEGLRRQTLTAVHWKGGKTLMRMGSVVRLLSICDHFEVGLKVIRHGYSVRFGGCSAAGREAV